MQNLKLSIQEAQELLLMSQSSVYSWIDKGKLQTADGPSGKLIVISSNEANQIRELNLKSKRNKASKQVTGADTSFRVNSSNLQEETEILRENIETPTPATFTDRLVLELKELAMEAGKYKQLEIIRNEEKENAKYWQEKFFEINHALIEKNYEISALNQQISELKAELEKAKKRKWFGL